jgi:cyclopropane fatty-acyl-phospholipid synthase-like methyltransferase
MVKTVENLPGEKLEISKMPGHWLLARLGKRVLRPGGRELTGQMLENLRINSTDAVVEFAPGLGLTARMVLNSQPASYTGVERDETAAETVRHYLSGPNQRCLIARAEDTGLETASVTVVFGEAMLTMNKPGQKANIIAEAYRVLQPGGRYGLHELCLTPDSLDEHTKATIQKELSESIHVGARPLTISEWRTLLEAAGFKVRAEKVAPMHLLESKRLLKDEGWKRTLLFAWNVLRNPAARKRVLAMRKTFRRYRHYIGAIMLVLEKPQ